MFNIHLSEYLVVIPLTYTLGGTKSHFSNMTKPLILKGFIHFNEKI